MYLILIILFSLNAEASTKLNECGQTREEYMQDLTIECLNPTDIRGVIKSVFDSDENPKVFITEIDPSTFYDNYELVE